MKPSMIGKTTIVIQFTVVLEAVIRAPVIVRQTLWTVTGLLTLVTTIGYILDGVQRCSEGPSTAEAES